MIISNSHTNNNNNNTNNVEIRENDLDSSNVLYDEDFEIDEEEKIDNSRGVSFHDNAPASTLFNNND